MSPTLPHDLRDALSYIRERTGVMYGDRLHHLALFGSHARGDAHEGSDLDLLVVLSGRLEEYAEAKRLAPLAVDVWEQHGFDVQFVPFPQDAFADETHPLMMNVAPEAIDLAAV